MYSIQALIRRPSGRLLRAKSTDPDNMQLRLRNGYRTKPVSNNLPSYVRQDDVVVVASGQPYFVRGDWLNPGATVIDVQFCARYS